MKRFVVWALAIVLPLAAGCSKRTGETPSGPPQWKGTAAIEGGIEVVRNPREPIHAGRILEIQKDWSVGGEGKTGEGMLGRPWALDVDETGNLYVLDTQTFQVKVFDRLGRFVRAIGRRGQGPGDIGYAFAFSLKPGSSEVAVDDGGNRRIDVFSTKGDFLRSVPTGEAFFAGGKVDSRGRIFGLASAPHSDVRMLRIEADGKARTEILRRPELPFRPDPFMARDAWTLDRNGRLIYGYPEKYQFSVYDPEGRLVRRIVRDFEPIAVTRADILEFEKRPTPPGISHASNIYSGVHVAFRSVFTDDLGHIFVQTWERTPGGWGDWHDVFDDAGRFVGRAALPRHPDIVNPATRVLKAGKLYAIEPDEQGFEVVTRYSVTWLIAE